jgi:hypothetical protein
MAAKKKPLEMTPAAKAGFENGSGMKFSQPRWVHVLTAQGGFVC